VSCVCIIESLRHKLILKLIFQENIHSIMESETQVNALMKSIDKSISAIEQIDAELTDYEEAVMHVKSAVEKIEEENSQIGTASKNNQLLLNELSGLVQALDFPYGSYIVNADLSSPEGVQKATKAVFSLKDALQMENMLHPALIKMRAVTDQKRILERLRSKFSQNLTSHLAKLFIHHGNVLIADSPAAIAAFRFPQLSPMHKELSAYSELMDWLKTMDMESYQSLRKTYISSMQKIYERNIRALFEEAKMRVSGSTSLARRTFTLKYIAS